MFKMPSFARSNASLPLLSSLPSFNLFRTESAKSEQSDSADTVASEPPPYASVVEARPQLTWVAGYYCHGEEKFLAIVAPTPDSTSFHYSRDASDMQTKFNDSVAQGLKMSFINVHASPDGGMRYCHGYAKPSSEAELTPWYAAWNLDFDSFVAKNRGLVDSGYACVHMNVCGRQKGGNMFAGIWDKPSAGTTLTSEVVHSVNKNKLAELYSNYCFDANTGEDRHYRDASGTCAYEDGTGYIKFATVFSHRKHKSTTPKKQFTRYLVTRSDLEKQLIDQQKAGYRAITINPFVLIEQELFNCTWQEASDAEATQKYIGISRDGLDKVCKDLDII